jgi:glycosyltransferase involved in cell wall biosynthesis
MRVTRRTLESAPSVLFVNHTSRLSGAELVLIDVAAAFVGRSEVWLFEDGPLRKKLSEAGVPSHLIGGALTFAQIKRDRNLLLALPLMYAMPRIVLAIARAARKHDIIYANSQKAFVLASIAAALARRPLIWHLHDILNEGSFRPAQIKLDITLSNHFAARVVVPSQAVADAFIAAGGNASKVRVVELGIDLPPPNLEIDGPLLRRELGLNAGPLLGVFGRLAHWKGQHVLLDALARLPGFQAIVVGDALFGEENYKRSLIQQVARLGLESRVRFLGHRENVSDLMRAVDLVVHTSVEPEPFGRVIVEAMLCGKPIVATNFGGVPDILGTFGVDLLYPPGDVDALVTRLETLASTPSLAYRLGEGLRIRALDFYPCVRMQSQLRDVVSDVWTEAA